MGHLRVEMGPIGKPGIMPRPSYQNNLQVPLLKLWNCDKALFILTVVVFLLRPRRRPSLLVVLNASKGPFALAAGGRRGQGPPRMRRGGEGRGGQWKFGQ